ncbi:MAG TPA: peptidylprolyl isomerase [Nitrospirae bacterium]|nr:putative peptidyl-prolyl cis-trans isomerase Cbf2 precursor [bacterium BMS3Abin10]GBE38389.1 putative peptidyl-prolyl cis-trans isomerase Cbf2 precursor [bacterium BMS3Bbin08]HDH51723.1 peptidylprolyl isomerase [Nitrospirota bacterium]HDK81275.1 peptidylprolyl isomerase [Nitrospirota bacterium]
MKKLLILIFAVMIITGCNTAKQGAGTGKNLAKINSTTITKEAFLNKLEVIPEWARARFQSEEGKKELLNEMVKEELLYQEAKKQGLNKDKDFIEKVKEFKKMTLLSALLKKEIENNSRVDEQEIRNFYDTHPEEFTADLQVKARHILVDTEEEANDILGKLKKGADFAELAKKYSKDKGSAVNGGDLGFFGRGRMVPEFEHVAFNLKPGEPSSPVKTQFGFHIIEVMEKKEGTLRGFEEVKNSIQRRLAVEKQKNAFDSYIEELKKKNKVETYEEALKDITFKKTPETPNTPPH